VPVFGGARPGTVAASTADGGGPTVTAPGEADGQGERRGAVRWWLVAPVAAVAVVLAAGVGWQRWDRAAVHGASTLASRTTSEDIGLDVQRGEVRVVRIVCRTDDPHAECVSREPGIAVTASLPGGRTGATFTVPDVGYGPPGTATDPTTPAAARVLLTAGLGVPPGSEDEQVVVVRATPAVARVRATRRDGSVDEVVPVDGWAVLATRSGWGRGFVEAVDVDGRVIPLR